MVSAGSAEQSEQVQERPQQSERPRIRFRKETIIVRCWVLDANRHEESVPVEAKVCAGTGLAIHPAVYNGAPMRRGLWTVTHVPSGLSVTNGLRGEKAARAEVARLLTLPIHWEQDAETVRQEAAVMMMKAAERLEEEVDRLAEKGYAQKREEVG